MVTIVKFGGSLITDKTQRSTLRDGILSRLSQEIRTALDHKPQLKLILGHGSGSFGHFEAKQYNTIQGVATQDEWHGFASVGRVAAELNYHVARSLGVVGLPTLRIQPSASAITRNGMIQHMAIQPILRALEHNLVPLVYGDVAFDDELGGTIISTETIITFLASKLPIQRIFLVGEVDGVYDHDGDVIPEITAANFNEVRSALGGSSGVDVTGGMLTKVRDMLQIASQAPYPDVYILNGLTENLLVDALLGKEIIATKISV